ncbi:MAG: hypothetical protein AAGH68_08895 [Pseudomonadota bacterium]
MPHLSRGTKPVTNLFRFPVSGAGGASTPAISKSGTLPVWKAYEGGVEVASVNATAASHTFAAGADNYWELLLPDDDPQNIAQLWLFGDVFAGQMPRLYGWTALEGYHIYANAELTGVDLTGLAGLTHLNVSGTNVGSVDLHDLPLLVYLNTNNSQLTSLDVSAQDNLVTVWIHGTSNFIDQPSIDALLQRLSESGVTNGQLIWWGNAAATDGSANVHLRDLIDVKGWSA